MNELRRAIATVLEGINGMKKEQKQEITKFLGDSVKALINHECSCCRYILDEELAIFVGWSQGYGDEARGDCIQDSDEPDWAINAGLKIRNDFLWCDYDFLDFPCNKKGEIYDSGVTIEPNQDEEDYAFLADWFYRCYKRVKKFGRNKEE